jgi:2-methylisoborneol synthase
MPAPATGAPPPAPAGSEATSSAVQAAHNRADLLARLLSGPSGLGTSAADLSRRPQGPPASSPRSSTADGPAAPSALTERAEAVPEPLAAPPTASPAIEATPYGFHEWGDGAHPPLYLPPLARDNPALGEAVNTDLVEWAEQIGLYEGRLDTFADTGYGQLIQLTHADTDDVESLLIAARLNAVWWAADDYYADEVDLGALPEKLSERLSLVMMVFDPPAQLGDPYDTELNAQIAADPVLVAARSAVARLNRRAAPDQLIRVFDATAQMFVSWNAYAAWLHNDVTPQPWRYVAARQHDSFHTSMTLVDVVGGYEPPAGLVNSQPVRQAVMQAGLAAVIVNDLHSLAKDKAEGATDFNLPTLIAHHTGCSTADAVADTVALHNRLVSDFERAHAALRAVPSPQLQRYLSGVRNWIAGGFAWHARSSRYAPTDPTSLRTS